MCEARFLDPSQRLSLKDERAHYAHHQNDVDDPGYRAFLSKLFDPLNAKLTAGSYGLDFGCGPGPALADMFGKAGHTVDLYDPMFAPDMPAEGCKYDFISCSEVIEHVYDPYSLFAELADLLKPGGLLGVMTCFQTDDARFANWHYRMDPTHVIFFRERTMREVALRFGWTCDIPRKDVAVFEVP
ncbi:MAG: class I SAM-dependent methyltransferase [Pseudomonadota bacterium]